MSEYDAPDIQDHGPDRGWRSRLPQAIGLGGGAIIVTLGCIALFLWVSWQNVDTNQLLVLVNKTGKPIPNDIGDEFCDQVVLYPELINAIAAKTGEPEEKIVNRYKGIRLDPLLEGVWFRNPYSYRRIKMDYVQIGADEVGVLIRKFGRPLEHPKTVATEPDERGPVAEILTTGRYPINLLAYEVQKFPIVDIPPGHVGVVTLLTGKEPKIKNTYTVMPGEKGVQRETLRPGREEINPYERKIDIVDIRNRTYHMLGRDAIHFPSNDSFTITIEGTMEWSIDPQRVAEVTVAYGDEQDIIDKIILPYARSISRIEGSKLQAREFISGKTRTEFQDRLLDQLKTACGERGVVIHAALVREITPPPEIAGLISQREQADQDIERSRYQIKEAEAEARLVEQQQMEARNTAVGDARRDTVSLTKQAEQRKVVSVTNAQRRLEVARLNLEAATKEAAAIVARGRADANVILFDYQARAEPLKAAVQAFGDGMTYAQHFFLQKVAPSIQSILSNTEGPFAEIFKSFQDYSFTPSKPLAAGGAK